MCVKVGGAVAINSGSIVTFNGTTIFEENNAQRQGGAISLSASSLVLGPSAITFMNNSALSGSAMYLMSSSTSSVTLLNASNIKIMIRDNVCRGGKQGGTVFVVRDSQTTTTNLFGPQTPNYNQRVVFVNNTAVVGRGVATQTTSLRSTSNHTTIAVTDYNSFLLPSLLTFNLVDAFNNINTTDFATTVIILYSNLKLPYLNPSSHNLSLSLFLL
jgi:predicted outer membrane repeat protein